MSFFTSFCDLPQKEQHRFPFDSSRLRSTSILGDLRAVEKFYGRVPIWASLGQTIRPYPAWSSGGGSGWYPHRPIEAQWRSISSERGSTAGFRGLLPGVEDEVDDAVFFGLSRTHVEVALDVSDDVVLRLAGALDEDA